MHPFTIPEQPVVNNIYSWHTDNIIHYMNIKGLTIPWSHDQILGNCHAGQANSITQRKIATHHAVKPKSRLNQQAADRETILVRRFVGIVLLLVELLLRLLLIVWYANTRGETIVSTFECTQQDIRNETFNKCNMLIWWNG